MSALKQVYRDGITLSPAQDSITVIPLPVDVMRYLQSADGENPTDFAWWDTSDSPGPNHSGFMYFRGNINYATTTGSAPNQTVTVRTEHGSNNPLIRQAEEIWGSISIYTVPGYVNDPLYELITQWHSGVGGSPPISIRRENGRIFWQIWTASGFVNQQILDVGPIPSPGGWTHFVYRIKWADDLTGRMTIWRDGKIARLYDPNGDLWVVPESQSGVSTNWLIKPSLGTLPYTVVEGEQEASIADWYGRISHIGEGIMDEKYPKHGIYKSSLTNRFNNDGTLKTGWDIPEDPMFIPLPSRETLVGLGNLNYETRVNEFTHEEIFKSLDHLGEGPLETPVWWVNPEPVNITSPEDDDNFEEGEPIDITTDATEGDVELIVNGNSVETKSTEPYSFQIEDIPINGAAVDFPFNGNLHNWGDFDGPISLIRPENTDYVSGVRGQAIKLFNGGPGNSNRSYIAFPNTGPLASISTEFTISFFIKAPSGAGLNPYLIVNSDDTVSGFRIYPGSSDGRLQIWLHKPDGSSEILRSSSSATFDDLDFHHFTITYDGSSLKWYYNFAIDSQTSVDEVDISATADWRINAAGNYSGQQDIIIDDFRIYDRALSLEKIEELNTDNYLGELELKVRRSGVESDPITINVVEELPEHPSPDPIPDFIKHPIALNNQKYLLPANAVAGDQIGEVKYLYTFCKFWNEHEGTELTENQFSFSKISGPANFIVDPTTGMISINSMSGISEDTEIEVRVSIDGMSIDVTCIIQYIPTADCIFIDPSHVGTESGTRSQPYKKFKDAGLGSGTPGKSYFFKRGTTVTNDWIKIISPKSAGKYPEYINIGAYGQGEKPIVNGSNNEEGSINHRFITLGDAMSMDGSEPSKAANNVRVFDIETTLDSPESNDWYPFEIKILGDNLEFHRIKCSNVGLWEDGFFWITGTTDAPAVERNILLRDIETYQNKHRAIKVESSGVRIYNYRGVTTLTQSEFPISFSNKPIGQMKFLDISVTDHVLAFGAQIRAHDQNYEWMHIEGANNPLTVYPITDEYEINSENYFKNIILKDCKERLSFFSKASGVTIDPDGVIFQNIKAIDCEGDLEVAQGAENTKIIYCDLGGNGIRMWSSAGDGLDIHNTKAGVITLDLASQEVEIVNTQYESITGPHTLTASTTSIDPEDLLEMGIDLGYDYDIIGHNVSVTPTIGPYEELEVEATFTITATATTGGQVSGDGEYEENEEVTLTATPDSGYEFVRWTEDSETVSTNNPYIFNAEGDRTLLAVFQQIEYQLTVTYTAGGTATGSGEYIAGSQVQLTATPNSGYSFVGWYRGGTLISTSNPYNYTTRQQDDTVEARFELIPIPEFTITVIPSTGGTVTGGGTYEEGQSVTLSAMPQSGWTFVKWSNDATDNPYSFTASENLTISAIFEEVNPEVPYITVKGKFKIV